MDWDSILNDVISTMHADYVPLEFVVSAKYIDRYGVEHTLQGNELAQFMANPHRFHVREAQVVLDVVKIRRAMHDKIIEFFIELNERLAND